MSKTDLTYQRTVLQKNEHFEVVSCLWKKGDTSAMHGHGSSNCMVLVEEGQFENITDTGFRRDTQVVAQGNSLATPRGARHEITCLSEYGKTLHVYSPPIQENIAKNFKPQSLDQIQQQIPLEVQPAGVEWNALKATLEKVRDHSVATHSRYFMNQLFTGTHSESFLAEEILTQTKSTMSTFEASPIFSLIEMEIIHALGKQLGWQQADGVTVPGGSAANFMALHCARQKKFPYAKTKGMAGEKVRIFVSKEAHYSFKKAAAVLGFGTDSLVYIDTDPQGRMSPEALELQMANALAEGAVPLLVCATTGTTVLGAFDPIDKLSPICKKYQTWLHVDGAWGGPVIFSKTSKELVKGIEKVDSLTFDAHKLYGASLTSSFFVTSHENLLLESNDVTGGDYLFHDGTEIVDRGRLSWQCGRKAEALSFWTIWKSLGTDGLGEFVDRLMNVQKQTVEWIATQSRLELVTQPEYLNLCVRIKPPEGKDEATWAVYVRNQLREKDQAMINYSTDAHGRTFLRLILAHNRIDFPTIQKILQWAQDIQ